MMEGRENNKTQKRAHSVVRLTNVPVVRRKAIASYANTAVIEWHPSPPRYESPHLAMRSRQVKPTPSGDLSGLRLVDEVEWMRPPDPPLDVDEKPLSWLG